jgi:hypothetical protein
MKVCPVHNSGIINVAPYQNGVGDRDGWTHINGWSERVLDYIQEIETMQPPTFSTCEK